MTSVTDSDRSVAAISDMAFQSLWFLGACMQESSLEKTVGELYGQTIDASPGISTSKMNAGAAVLGAYALMVLPRGAVFEQFSKAVTGLNKIDWSGFTWAEPGKFSPNCAETNWQSERSEHRVLGGIRNALTHGNLELVTSADDPTEHILHLWSQKEPNLPRKRHVHVSAADLAAFSIRFYKLFTAWTANGKAFEAAAAPTASLHAAS